MTNSYIRTDPDQSARLIEQMARFACAAYYRGQLEIAGDGPKLEEAIKLNTKANWPQWIDAAKAQLSMAYVLLETQNRPAQLTNSQGEHHEQPSCFGYIA